MKKSTATAVLLLLISEVFTAQTFDANLTEGCTPLGIVITVTSPDPGTISSYAWIITYPDGSTQTASSSTYIAIFSQPGGYDVSLTINGNSNTTITDYITVYGLPTANFTIDDGEGCWPLCVQFTDTSMPSAGSTIVDWVWDFGNGLTSTDQNPTYCYPMAGTFTPVFGVEDNHGCFDDISQNGLIEVNNDFPVADFTLSSTLDCEPPVTIVMTNNSTSANPPTTTWDFGDGNSSTAAGVVNATHIFNDVGTYDVCLTMVDDIGCENQLCQPVVIFDTANATFILSDDEVCENETVNFTDTTVPTPLQWQWDLNDDGVMDSNNQNPAYSYPTFGTYYPDLIVTYSTTCADTLEDAYAIDVIEGIDVLFQADTTASCQLPFNVLFTNLSTGPGALSYNWFINGTAVSTTSSSFTHTFNSYGLYDVQLIVSNNFGCQNSLTMPDYIIVQPPQVSFQNETSICTGENVPIFNITINSVDPVTSWLWDFDSDGNTDAIGGAPAYSYPTPGNYTITLNVETANGCQATFTSNQSVTVLMQVTTDFAASTTYTCAGEEIEFCVEYQPGNTYSWNFGDDTGWQSYAYFDTCVTHDYIDTGFFDVSLTVFNGACNIMVEYLDFIYILPPVALFDFEVDCSTTYNVAFSDASILADSITWDFGDGSPLVINDPNPVHTFPGAGEYLVTLTAFNDTIPGGCPDFKVLEVVVEPVDLNLTFSPTSGCPPLMVDIADNTTNYYWDVTVSNGDHINVVWNDFINKWVVTYTHDGTTESFLYGFNVDFWPTLSFENAGYYDISVIGTNPEGCSDSLFYDNVIFVSANPDFASFSYDFVNVCDSVHIGFIPDDPGLVNLQWTFSNGETSTDATPYITFDPPYDYVNPLWATLSASDTLGCSSEVTQEIMLEMPATAMYIVANDPSCQNDTVNFVNQSYGNIVSYLWDFGDPSSGPLNTSTDFEASHLFAQNGTYPICLTVENGSGCFSTMCDSNAVHIVNPEIDFEFTSTIDNCLYGVQFEDITPDSLADLIIQSWNFGDGQTGSGETVYHTFSIGVYNVVLVVMNEYACIDTLEIPDILNYGDVIGPFTQVLDTAVCTPFMVEFQAFNPADTYFEYFWDFDDGNGDPSDTTGTTQTYTDTGIFCPSIIMTDPNGCPVLIECVDSIYITAFDLEFSQIESICYGDSLHLEIDNGTSYVWQDPTYVTESSTGVFELYPPVTTDFILTGYYSDCETTDTITVEVNQLPIVTLDMMDEVCHQYPVFNLYGGLPDIPTGEFFVDGTAATQFDPSSTPELFYEIIYKYTDLNQCSNTDTVQLFVHALPNVTLTPFAEDCEDDPVIPMQGGSPLAGIYTENLTPLTQFDPATGEGTYNIVYTFTDQYGCINSDSQEIVIHPVPDVVIDFTDICLDAVLLIDNQSTIPYETIDQTLWDFGAQGTSSSFDPEPVSYPAIGNYPLAVAMITAFGCDVMVDTTVNVWAVPQAAFTTMNACQYTDFTFVNQSSIEAGAITNWDWNLETSFYASGDSVVHNFQTWGTLPVLLVATSDNGCVDSLTQFVESYPAPVVEISFANNCYEETSMFGSNISIPQGSIANQQWAIGDSVPIQFTPVVEHIYSSPADYALELSASSDMGCLTIIADTITIYPLPIVEFTVEPTTYCALQPLTLVDASTVAAPYSVIEWAWIIGDSLISEVDSTTTTFATPGTYDFYLSVTTDVGCTNDTLMEDYITIYPLPVAGVVADPNVTTMYNPFISFIDNADSTTISWYYDFGDGSTGADSSEVHEYATFGNYEVTQIVMNQFGCLDTTYTQVEVEPDLLIYVPNAFTPDNDGLNDLFKPVLSGFEILSYEFSVWNRWGERIFVSEDHDKGWMGNVRGGELFTADGVYTWMLRLRPSQDAAIRTYKGHVTMLR